MTDLQHSPIQDPRVNAVIARLQGARQRPARLLWQPRPSRPCRAGLLDPSRNGFLSMALPLKGGTELSLKVK
ncbi:hypothetical protein [Bradyrhizobium diazoefficiens]|uniref:hypothetical protein n=1 Tax=Bradyrhizobium diazoefficiens TaxID=1355477 RepID=UPI001FEDD9B3|nr:hypothetical protein [Bradyrhizobium diazoefficiens]